MKLTPVDSLLINPVSAKTIPAFIPHGLLYIASYALERGYSIAVYDRNVDSENINDVLLKLKPRVVGLGCLTGTSIDDAIFVSKEVRKFDSLIKIVWGGIHTTLYPDSVLKNGFVDFVIIGDGEGAFSGLLDYAISKKKRLEDLDNIGYKDSDRLKYTTRSFFDLEELPQPAWHLIKVEKYIRRKFYANRVITINTSRGCPYKCSFCCVPKVHLGNWRGIRAEKIIENLKYLKENYLIDGFQVDDDEFDINRERVLTLCDLLQKNNLKFKWSHFSRINIVKEDVLKAEIKSGLRLVEFGIESGSDRVLSFLNKGQTVEQIINVFNLCRRLKLKVSALFMIGLPTETADDLMATVKLVKRLNPYITLCTIYRPYPGTELFNYCINERLFTYDDNLEGVGSIYERIINTSKIDTNFLLKIKDYFDRRNIYQEIKFIIARLKFDLFIYYLRYYVLKQARKT